MSWSSAFRGNTLEELINLTNDIYRQKGLACVQKIPTPIQPVRMDNEYKNFIVNAYFERKSTVDYIGAVQGVPVAFDAKETARKSFPLSNIYPHQLDFMRDFSEQGGAAFLIVCFREFSETFLLPFEELAKWVDAMNWGGRKSIPKDAFDPELRIEAAGGAYAHYLPALDKYSQRREKDKNDSSLF